MTHFNLKAVFFDLDGTLLDLSDDQFEKTYAPAAYKHFSDIFSLPNFMKSLFSATEKMLKHDDPNRPVVEVFFEYFAPDAGLSVQEAMNRFIQFYKTDFNELQKVSFPIKDGPEIVQYLHTHNIPIIIATQPVFYSLATEKRIQWAGLNPADFLHITHATNSYSCKPSVSYFQHLLDIVGVQPDEVLMVGNDYLFDMSAQQLGIHTWLTNTHITHPEYKDTFPPEFTGSLAALQTFIQKQNK